MEEAINAGFPDRGRRRADWVRVGVSRARRKLAASLVVPVGSRVIMESTPSERLLTEIRDIQKQMLALQERTTAIVERQYARAEKIQDRAEAMQAKSEGMVTQGRRFFMVILPVLVFLIGYVSWILFTRMGH